MNQVIKKEHKSFESIRKTSKEGQDFWSARDLQIVLGYKSWDKFKAVIQKAIKACENSKNSYLDHFSHMGKMVKIGSGTELATNLFRATQTDEKLKRDNIKGKNQANQTHYEVGKKVRKTIKRLRRDYA